MKSFVEDTQLHKKPLCIRCGSPAIIMIHSEPFCGDCTIKYNETQRKMVIENHKKVMEQIL